LAESELGVLTSQCLDRRIPDKQAIIDEVARPRLRAKQNSRRRPTPAAPTRRSCWGLAIISGIDRFMSEVRALTNIVGKGVATIVVSIWGELNRAKMDAALAGVDAEDVIVAAEFAPD
jgi:hypothetical protein